MRVVVASWSGIQSHCALTTSFVVGAVDAMNIARGGAHARLSRRFDLRLGACYSIETSSLLDRRTKAAVNAVCKCNKGSFDRIAYLTR